MSIKGSGSTSWLTWLGIFAVAAFAAFFITNKFFPEIIEQMAAGIIALFALLFGLVFRKKKN
jgi:LPXTG-motif cell wall-anchored protein